MVVGMEGVMAGAGRSTEDPTETGDTNLRRQRPV